MAIEPSPFSCLCSFPVADHILDSISSKAWSLFLIIVDIRQHKTQRSPTRRESVTDFNVRFLKTLHYISFSFAYVILHQFANMNLQRRKEKEEKMDDVFLLISTR